ncbi:GNAT family N-acetyltransferase [Salinimonas iocasae]|uniref:GNAT family N-acetyltransferase n=1 Tax=Salinimonas iocasae TaxID=2572577 RepID=A0A5B7YFL6_9ALTE|nr:GNAT family N-acetyltransferase [Salinimonas iocasae]QCZ94023.1 GNAT family N-acetyltransferase [Salinimonas iocasae]
MEFADTERLKFSYITADEADFLWELDQDEEVMKHLNGGVKTTREEIETVFLPRLAAYANPALGWGLWKVILKDSDEPIGWILVRPYGFFTSHPEVDNIELGWRFKRAFWGKGYATEAAQGIRDGLASTGISKFSAVTLPENENSIAIMKKLGMTYSHSQFYEDSVFSEDVVVYSQCV